MKNVFAILFAGMAVLFQSGCFWSGDSQTARVFDMSALHVKSDQLPYQVHFSLFRNISGSDRRFLKRLPGNRVTADEFNRWLLDPELMLERYFRNRFRGTASEIVRVRGVITAFEINTAEHCSELAVDFTLHFDGRSRLVSCREKKSFSADSRDPDAAAVKAMNLCADSMAAKLGGEIRKLINAPAGDQEKNK